MNYYTSDLHLGHYNIIKLCNRPFDSVQQMNETLITNWNARVHNDDDVYIVGDFAFRNALSAVDYLKQLTGIKHLIIGNHDKRWMKQVRLSEYFESVDRMLEFNDGKRNLVLCHYPMFSWGSGRESYLIYGHIHGNKPASYWPVLSKMNRALNASVEVNGYKPVTFDELVENNVVFRTN
jgi:calcineurin-like phosphoesterase family protein